MKPTGVLSLPHAHGGPVGGGTLRSVPEDFTVREWLGFAADGTGDHWLLTVRKRGANTHWVAEQLAKLARVHPRDVGYAGLKDRNALAEQAFSIPVRSAVSDWLGVAGEGFEVIAARRHRRKLKRGTHKGNDFQIIVRGFDGDGMALAERLRAIAQRGVPNYYGPQRFGHAFGNLERACALFSGRTQRLARRERGLALSAARAHVFNAVLAERVVAGSWDRLIEGDIVNLDGSQSIFAPEEIDATLQARCARLDVHPTGPLWGAGEPPTSGAARAFEERAAAANAALCAGLAAQGLKQERRALRSAVRALDHELTDGNLVLRFRLSRGAFATAVLHEIVAGAFELQTPEAES